MALPSNSSFPFQGLEQMKHPLFRDSKISIWENTKVFKTTLGPSKRSIYTIKSTQMWSLALMLISTTPPQDGDTLFRQWPHPTAHYVS